MGWILEHPPLPSFLPSLSTDRKETEQISEAGVAGNGSGLREIKGFLLAPQE